MNRRKGELTMNRKFHSGALACLLTLLAGKAAYAVEGDQHIDLGVCSGALPAITWAGKVGDPAPTPIILQNSGGSVDWSAPSFSSGCGQASAGPPIVGKCLANGGTPEATGQVTFNVPSGVTSDTQLNFTGTITFETAGMSTFGLHVARPGNLPCDRDFQLRVNASGGGWGDPHLTTVDGVKYDFQSAGEFTALREPGFEVQTRQVPVASTGGGLRNEHTGLTTCVALYSAVAAKLGSSRVTLQPNGGGKPADQMELRVDGKLVTLSREGIDLSNGGKSNGRIVQSGDNIEVTDANGTRLVVTPQFWSGHDTWYLNINVFDTTAREGTMGMIASESWLPALPDGSSVGSQPEGDAERYEVLYEKFADAWRVTDDTSLFDYPAGKKTADFTLDEWPRNNPQSCALEGQTPVQGTDQATAEAACAAIANPDHKKDCIFDVQVTGFEGFAKGYAAMKDLKPGPTGWTIPTGSGGSEPPKPGDWRELLQTWWWLILLILLLLIVLWRLLKKKSAP
jgi:hypothetical protein